MVPPENPPAGKNSGRHRAPDGDAQTAYIPRITDASPDGVPGGPLAPPVGLGANTQAPGVPHSSAVVPQPEGVRPQAPTTAAPVAPGDSSGGGTRSAVPSRPAAAGPPVGAPLPGPTAHS